MKKIRQRLLSGLLSAFLMLQTVPAVYGGAPADDDAVPTPEIPSGSCGLNVEWVLEKDGILTISGTGKIVDYSPVGSSWAPWSQTMLTQNGHEIIHVNRVIIEEGITEIGTYAFTDMPELSKISIPDSVTRIEEGALSVLYNLTQLDLPENLEYIGMNAFASTSIEEITIPAAVIEIGDSAFYDCMMLKTVTFEGVNPPEFTYENIEEVYFFEDTESLEAIYVPLPSVDKYKTALSGLVDVSIVRGYEDEYEDPTPEIIASGQCGADGDNVLWQLDSDGVFTLSGSGAMQNLSVSHSSNPWKNYFDEIRKVVIEDGITNIGAYAFQTSDTLTEVVIPDSVTVIGEGAFDNCSALTEIELPTSLVTIGDKAFYQSGLTEIELPDSVRKIGFMSFYDCTSLTTAVLNEGLQTIDDGAFALSGLTEIVIPESVYEFGPGDTGVFQECTDLQTAVLPETLASIPSSMFYGCSSLTEIEIPETVTAIGDWVFADCTAISSIIFRGTVPPEFGENVFKNMSALTAIHVPAESYDAYVEALTGLIDTSLIVVPEPEYDKINRFIISDYDYNTFYLNWEETGYESSGVSLVLEMQNPDGTWTEITGESCMSPSIDFELPFSQTVNLIVRIKILAADDETLLAMSDPLTVMENGFVYSVNNGNASIRKSPNSPADTNIVIPETIAGYPVTAIELSPNNEPVLWQRIENFSIPAGVTYISDDTYELFGNLYRITVAEENTVYSSDSYGVLYNKEKTKIIHFPMYACRSSKYVLPDTLTVIPKNCFDRTQVGSVVVHAGVTSIEKNAFQHAGQLTKITVSENNAYYSSDEYGVLFNKEKTELIRCPQNITVTEYTIPDSVVTVADNAFYYCTDMQTIHLPDGLVTIGEDAFCTCYNVTELNLPSTVKTIGKDAFYSWDKLISVTIPESVVSLAEGVFRYCDNLTSVTVLSRTVTFGSDVFYGCSPTIYGYAGSTAETFAEENNLTFVALEEPVEDVSAPEVLGVYPEAGSTIGLNTAISVKVSDDLEVDTLNVSYSTDNTAWYDLDAVSVGEASAFVTVPLDVSELDGADTVSLQITCTDPAGNTSEALEVSYSIDTVLPEAAALSAQETFSGIVLTWDPINTDDLAGFRIYRKAEGDANYRQIRAFAPVSDPSYTYTHTDYSVSYETTYTYYVVSEDFCGNTSASRTITVARSSYDTLIRKFDTQKPSAGMTLYRFGDVGEVLTFDARNSSDNGKIVSYHWTFGDGTSADGITAEKSYTESGIYTVTLTVTDAAGLTDTQSASITIRPKKTGDPEGDGSADPDEGEEDPENPEEEYVDTGDLIVKVVDTDGKTLSGAKVYFNMKSDNMQIFYTGSNGTVRIRDVGGTYEVGANKSGYAYNKTVAKIVNNSETELEIRLAKSEMISGTFEAERMTLSEIEAAGINTNDPDNQFVYKFVIELEYSLTPPASGGGYVGGTDPGYSGGGSPTINKWEFPFPFYANDEGKAVGYKTDPIYIDLPESNEKLFVHPPQFHPTEKGEPPVPIVSIIRLPGEATWLKDFFEVSLEIINLAPADSGIVLENCVAELSAPDALTLMDTLTTYADPTYRMDDIEAGTSEKATWILRGDKAGSYSLSAEFRGQLVDFDEVITARFVTEDPIRVRAGNNLYMDVIVEDTVEAGSDSAIRIGLRNEDPEPYYMPNVTLENVIPKGDPYKTSGNERYTTNLDTLNPGEEIWFEYVIKREDFPEVFEDEESQYYLVNQVAKYVDGVKLQTTFRTVPPYTISGDRVEVYYIDPDSGVEHSANYIDIETDFFKGRMPDLVIKTYRLINNEYKPGSMEFTVTDPLREKEEAGDKEFSGKTGADGTYTIKGYDIKQASSEKNYTIKVQSNRAPVVEIPVTVAWDLGTGSVKVTVCEYNDGVSTLIANAAVTIGKQTEKTNSSGIATFEEVDNGWQTITVSAAGYIDAEETVRIKNKTELEIRMYATTSEASIIGVKSSLGSIVYIPYGLVTGELSFELKKNIPADEQFVRYHYKIEHKNGTVETGSFNPISTFAMVNSVDKFTINVEKLRVGSKLYFAVETDIGISDYIDSGITVIQTLSFFANIKHNISFLTSITSTKFKFKLPDKWEKLIGNMLDNIINGRTDLLGKYRTIEVVGPESELVSSFLASVQKTESSYKKQRGYHPIELEFDFTKGEFLAKVGLGGTKKEERAIFQYVVDGRKLELSKSEGESYESVVFCDFIFKYHTDDDYWTWRVQGSQSLDYDKTIISRPLGFLGTTGFSIWYDVGLVVDEMIKLSTKEFVIGTSDDGSSIKNNLPANTEITANGDIKISLYEQWLSDEIHKAGVYMKTGLGTSYNHAEGGFKWGLRFELGWEAKLLIWETEGKWVEAEAGFGTETSTSASRALLAARDTSSDTYSTVKAPESVQWNNTPVDNILQSEVFHGANQQIVTLNNGTKLMVYADTDEAFDANNPVKLKYSVNTDGTWSEPQVVCTDNTVDLQPSLTVTDNRAVLVWQDMGQVIGDMGMTSIENIRDLYNSMEIRMSEFDGTAWSEPVTVSDSECLVYAPAAASDGNTVMTAWIVNESNLEAADADHPDAIWYALTKDGEVVDSGKLVGTYVTASNLDMSVVNGTYVMTCTAKNADGKSIAYKSSYNADEAVWNDAEKISAVKSETVALTTAEDGTIYYIMDGRLYRAGNPNTVLAVSDTLDKAQELSVLVHDGKTYFAWVGAASEGIGLYLCYMDESGAVSEPVPIVTGETERYDTPVLAPDGEDSILAVYLTAAEDADYPEDYVLNYTLNCAAIDLEQDISLEEASHSQPLYAGAEVTTSFVCRNLGLLSVSDVTAFIYDADGNLVAEAECSGLADAIAWTVPDTYDGEVYTLKVIPADGQDADETNNSVSIDRAFTDLEALNVTYIGEEGQNTSLILSLKNNGLVTSREVTAVVADRMTDTVLAEISLGDISGGAETDHRISVNRGEYNDLTVTVRTESCDLSADNNRRYLLIDDEITIEVPSVTVQITAPAAVYRGETFTADIVLKNAEPAAALALSDFVITPAHMEILEMEWLLPDGRTQTIDPESGTAAIVYDEATDMNGPVLRLTLRAADVSEDTACEISCSAVLETNGVSTEITAASGNIEIRNYISGDTNGDNEVTYADATYLLRHTILSKRYPLHGAEFDYNGDGNLTADDAAALLERIPAY